MTGQCDERTVLIWAPRGRNAELADVLLGKSGFSTRKCRTIEEVAANIGAAGCAVLTEEALYPGTREVLAVALAAQPPWSDFPVVLFARRSAKGISDALEAARVLGNVTLLERPVQSRTLVSAVVAALRSRGRQYEARAAIQRRDEFLAMLGHELRNPLAAIMLAADRLQLGSSPSASEVLVRQTRHLAQLVDDLLDVARVTTGKVVLHRAPVELRELLARCVQNAEGLARPHATRIVLRAGTTPAIVDGDAVRLEEVFMNLLSNAIKYSRDGSEVDVTLAVTSNRCVVEVRDRGIGLAPEMLSRVFDLFAQVDTSLDRSKGGLGIGLTVVKSIVELHGGKVSAHSPGIGQGTVFRIELPRTARAVTAEVALPIEAAPIAGLRVLVVEDNPDLLELTCDALTTAGCEVMGASDGVVGLDLIEHHAFDVALVDIGLPGIDGYELARRVRAAGDAPRLVAMSGYGQVADRERALAAGFDLHLTKPITMTALVHELRPGR